MSLTTTTSVGEHQVIAITDGETQFDAELFPDTDSNHIQELLKSAGADAIQTNFNAFVIKSPGRTMLVDAGPRDLFGPACGNLPDGLAAAGVEPDDISHLMLTHLHPDHIAGAVSPQGEAIFKNAILLVNEEEHRFWNRDAAFGDETLDQWQQLAKIVLSAYDQRVELFAANADLGGGVTSISLPGHTPGHSGFRVDDANESLVMFCDIVHAPDLQIADPEISIVFDIDAEMARTTRKRILEMVAADNLNITGGHMTTPKIARLQVVAGGYRLNAV